MTGLEQAFYIVGLVYMGISLLLIIGLVVAVAVIRAKIVRIEQTISDKLGFLSSVPSMIEGIVDMAKGLGKHRSK